MSQGMTEERLPWLQRVFFSSPLAPLWIGILLVLVFLLVFLILEISFDRFTHFEVETYREDLRVAVGLCLSAAYLPAAWLYSVRSAQRTAREIRPWLTTEEARARLDAAGRYDRVALRKAGLGGVASLLVALLLAESGPEAFESISMMSLEAYFHRVLLVFIGWFAGRAIYATWIESRRFSKVGGRGLALDLLDLSAAEPLSRYGLRQALVTIGAFSVMAPLFYDSNAAPNLVWLLLAASFVTVVLAIVALLFPVRGLHDAIAREKALEIDRINGKIRRARDLSDVGAATGLADWIAYRGLIESVREWPIDAPTLRRFALYLAIPLGSWLGGALVERMVDIVLG